MKKKKVPTVLEKLEKIGLVKVIPLQNGAQITVNISLVEEWLESRTINGKTVSKSLAANINGYLFPQFLRALVTAETAEDFQFCTFFLRHLATSKDFEKFFNENILHTVELFLISQTERFYKAGVEKNGNLQQFGNYGNSAEFEETRRKD